MYYEYQSFSKTDKKKLVALVEVPKDKSNWIQEIQVGKTNLNVKAYWYQPTSENQVSNNKNSKRIKIPLENIVNLELYPKLFKLLWKKNLNL